MYVPSPPLTRTPLLSSLCLPQVIEMKVYSEINRLTPIEGMTVDTNPAALPSPSEHSARGGWLQKLFRAKRQVSGRRVWCRSGSVVHTLAGHRIGLRALGGDQSGSGACTGWASVWILCVHWMGVDLGLVRALGGRRSGSGAYTGWVSIWVWCVH